MGKLDDPAQVVNSYTLWHRSNSKIASSRPEAQLKSMFPVNVNRPFQITVFSVMLVAALIPFRTSAEGLDLVVFTGIRGGGEFEDLATGAELELKEAQTLGIVIDTPRKKGNYWEFYYSKQPTKITSSENFSSGSLFDVDVEYLHFGGKNYINREDGTFLVGTIGATYFDPKTSGFDDEIKFSLGLGTGIEFGGDSNIGLRLEGRAFGTFLDSSGAIFCGGSSGGCTIITTSGVLWQLELNIGLIFRF